MRKELNEHQASGAAAVEKAYQFEGPKGKALLDPKTRPEASPHLHLLRRFEKDMLSRGVFVVVPLRAPLGSV
jgi:hypothetical protein